MAKTKTNKKSRSLLKLPDYQLAVALVLFIISAWLARDGKMAEWEKDVFNVIYGLPIALTPVFLLITQLGNITVFFILAAVYFVKRQHHVVVRLFLNGLSAYLLAGVAKDLLGRPRPVELLVGVIGRDVLTRGPGFPSGHVALATAVLLTIAHYSPKKYQWLAPAGIMAVAVSRIYLGAHAPLDVLGGFAIGWGTYALFRNVRVSDFHRKLKTKTINGLKKSPARHILK
jgi:glycosyltransferase 2 family protein